MDMHSENIGSIAAALAKAQGAFDPIRKTKTNPHLKNKYADLGDIRDAVQPALTANGLAVVQLGDGNGSLITKVIHAESGEWISSTTPVFEGRGGGAQGYGSGLTYARRYGLSAILSVVADDDDDGHGASGDGARRADPKRNPRPDNKPAPVADDIKAKASRLKDLIDQISHAPACNVEAFAKAHKDDWAALTEPAREFLENRIKNRAGVLAQAPDESRDLSDIPF